MHVTKALLIAAAAFTAAPLAAQATNEATTAENVPAAEEAPPADVLMTNDLNAADANVVAVPADPLATTDPALDPAATEPADDDDDGFPWGVLGLLGLLGLIPRLRR